ncbi:ligase-associated DNA damage response endonuclease PdeM [Niabella drilacis]|uniref:Putative phosphoesterase n=1 Tax=Niabella drilacis (strain DSM 25811 / CCM 8410 / CCUG 62505 / LMG 26954 / E90) TaxID=1285928 RepID=A0A1G6IEX2_NIADE|nr:ligase-associated DNA damage response endonuclease PdeM [Niabella drilacis]SDC05069.1 putative phosphoesterase [Niabella drilacis]
MPGTDKITIFYDAMPLVLSAGRAVYWPEKKMLILSDLHLGKTGYFRAHGIPVSSAVLTDDLRRLGHLIHEFKPEQVLVAGDMFHHRFNNDVHLFQDWRQSYKELSFLLVPGNHDRHMDIDYAGIQVTVTPETYGLGEIHFVHEMQAEQAGRFTISGHLHPGYRISGKAKQSLCLPCFIRGRHHLILPAFSQFTGLYTGASAGHTCYVISENKLFEF